MIPYAAYYPSSDDEPILKGGSYYCQCAYRRGETHCREHGDPCERWPETVAPKLDPPD